MVCASLWDIACYAEIVCLLVCKKYILDTQKSNMNLIISHSHSLYLPWFWQGIIMGDTQYVLNTDICHNVQDYYKIIAKSILLQN